MKKITFLFLAFIAFNFNYAQNTCATAVVVGPGTTTVGTIDGDLPNPDCAPNAGLDPRDFGEWYIYTPTSDVVVNITSDLPANAGGDTRLHIYTGTCGALTCFEGADDVSNTNFLTDLTFVASAGTPYYIAWDDQWSSAGFDFLLTESTFDCGVYGLPYNELYDNNIQFLGCFTVEDADANGFDWITQQDLDLDGDTIPETFATNSMGGATGLNVNDWMFSPGLSLTGGTEYELRSAYNIISGTATGSLEAFIVDAPSSTANVVATLFSNINFTTQGDFATLETNAYQEVDTFTPTASGTYYIAYRSFGLSGGGFILLFDSILESTLSINDFNIESFSHHYNKNEQTLNLDSPELAFDGIEIFSLLGQNVLTRDLSRSAEEINVSNLVDGIYLTKVTINGSVETFKFIKN